MEFDRFSPQSFERFVQALVMHVFGAGLVVFGPGPDGGREATFEGKIPFPNAIDGWDGYTVVQAKYKSKIEGPAENFVWLREQSLAEMNKFCDSKRKLKKPNNYLMVTNVNLSSVAHIGGKDQIRDFFDDYRTQITDLRHAVWSKDELITLLDNAEHIRRSFCAWLTPSDVLADLISSLSRPNLTRVAPLALARDLRQERDVRLRDAGQETETPIFLEDVFIDLPVETHFPIFVSHRITDEDIAFPQPRSRLTALKVLLSLSQEKHDGLTNPISGEFRPSGLPNRVVLLGGPGQGKSTLGQFLAQIFRVLLLLKADRASVAIPIRDAANYIRKKMLEQGIDALIPARFPFRIDLPLFADALRKSIENDRPISLLNFVRDRFQRSVDVEISNDDLRHWIGTCPNIIILDGLDEVPPSANRQGVIQAIEALWDDISLVQSDTLMIVTSRPQGYSNDLSPKYWQHWELQPLEAEESISYASKLAEIRLSDDERRDQILDALRNAVTDSATSQLMTSPLQVAIMFGIALLKGAIPSDRWDLFERYYVLLRDRESQKPGPLSAVFRDYKRQIDSIHYTVGFYLQALSEVPGNANIYLSDAQFKSVVEQSLRDDDFDDEDINSVTSDIMRLTTQRLVLLATRIEHQIAFDVRSLQEYMASAQMTIQSRKASTSARLRSIAGSAHWRHTFRISISKMFSVAGFEQHRDDVLAILHALDNGDLGEGGRLGRLGARLAASIVLDGVTNSSPRFLKGFARRALHALDLNPTHFREVNLLTSMYRPALNLMYVEELTARLSQGYSQETVGAWHLALDLMNSGHSFAKDLIIRYWPEEISEAFDLIIEQPCDEIPEEIVDKLKHQQCSVGFVKTYQFLTRWSLSKSWNFRFAKHIDVFIKTALIDFGFLRIYQSLPYIELALIKNKHDIMLSTKLVPLMDNYAISLDDAIPQSREWNVVRYLNSFLTAPRAGSLGEFLSIMNDNELMALLHGPQLNWVIQSVLAEINLCKSKDDIVESLEAGRLGDHGIWLAAEERWKDGPTSLSEYSSWSRGHYVHADIDKIGLPYFWTLTRSGINECNLSKIFEMIRLVEDFGDPLKRDRLCQGMLFVFNNKPNRRSLHIYERLYAVCLDSALNRGTFFDSMTIALKGNPHCWSSMELCLRVNAQSMHLKNGYRAEVNWGEVVSAYKADQSRRGLLPFVVYALLSRVTQPELDATELPLSALTFSDTDNSVVKSAVLVLQVIFRDCSSDEIVQSAHAILGDFWKFGAEDVRAILMFIAVRDLKRHEKILEQLWLAAVAINHSEKSFLSSLISRRAEAEETGLLSVDFATELDLPVVPAAFRKRREDALH